MLKYENGHLYNTTKLIKPIFVKPLNIEYSIIISLYVFFTPSLMTFPTGFVIKIYLNDINYLKNA